MNGSKKYLLASLLLGMACVGLWSISRNADGKVFRHRVAVQDHGEDLESSADIPKGANDARFFRRWQRQMRLSDEVSTEVKPIDDSDRPWRILYLPDNWESDARLVQLKSAMENDDQPGNPFNYQYGRVRPHTIVEGDPWYEAHRPIHRDRMPCVAIIGPHKVQRGAYGQEALPVYFKVSGQNFVDCNCYDAGHLAKMMNGKLVALHNVHYVDQQRAASMPLGWRLSGSCESSSDRCIFRHPRPKPEPEPVTEPEPVKAPVAAPPYEDTVQTASSTPWPLFALLIGGGVVSVGLLVGWVKRTS